MGTPSLQAKGTPRGVPFACYLGVGPGLGVPATAVGAAPAAAATVVRIGRGGHVAVVAADGPVVAAGRVAVVGTVVTGSPRAVGGVVAAAGAVAAAGVVTVAGAVVTSGPRPVDGVVAAAVGFVPTAGAVVAARAVAVADGVAVATGVDAANRAVGALRAVAVGIVADVVVDELITAVVLAQLDRVERPAAGVVSANGNADRSSHNASGHEAREHEHNESSSSDSHDGYLLVNGGCCLN